MAVSKPNNIPTTPHKETQYIRGNGAKRNRNAIPLPNVVPARKPSERPIGLSDFMVSPVSLNESIQQLYNLLTYMWRREEYVSRQSLYDIILW
ncbi:hypothetical protein [Paenibacillus silvae]|uniref:hypothetical protein n=1 Tax=Paenibacillus silvae TaxID=1325358 RepID=UPI00142DA776|nr:hypothetical protein [Paenibacillus silvae]MCK6074284.1 hypothetical protein [Paenibacillus silvae]MCK6148238.1 hypothetical protein [Paenibacillus silvae]MCK6266538.1 hypothetical protein [Paenibacillus silvae]